MQQQATHHKRLGKKGQVYPVFLAIFLIIALSYAFYALQGSKRMCTDPTKPCDFNNPTAYIGAKQNQVFYTLQDAEGIKLFVDQAARLAAEKSLDDIKTSCHYESSFEEYSDEQMSACGKHVYPLWSTKEELCLPDCSLAMTGSFYQNLNSELSKYYLATGITLPRNYHITISEEDEYTYLIGESMEPVILNSYPVKERKIIEDKPEAISEIESQTRNYTPLEKGTRVLLSWPVAGNKQINSCYGARDIKSGSKNHLGVDIQSGEEDVLSPAQGYVENAGNPTKSDAEIFKTGSYDIDSCWGRVIINHGSGIRTVFLHMQEIYVKPGQRVDRGQTIGKAGGRGRKGNACLNDQYPNHIHMEVHYDGVPASGQDLYSPDNNYGSQFISRMTSTGYAVNPLCMLDTNGAAFTGNNCNTPINKNLGDVCLKIGLLAAAKTNQENSITGDATKNILASETQPPSKYSFTPSFKVKVNKKLDRPLKEVTEWAEKTWNECTDDIDVCLNQKVDEFNNDETKTFEIKQAGDCEEGKKDLFFDMMEFFEDCLSNEQYGCKCEFNATGYESTEDFAIITDSNIARLYNVEMDSGKEILTRIEGAEYEISSGSIKSGALSFKEFRFKFNEDSSLKEIIFSAYNQDEQGNKGDSSVISEGQESILLVKVQEGEETNKGELVAPTNANFAKCLPRKDKFRLCAEPKEGQDQLFPVKFSLQLKDEPPKKFCQDAEVTVTPENVKVDAQVKEILSLKGFDMTNVFSAIPIPAFQLLGQSIAIADLVSGLPDSQNIRLRVTVKNKDPDIVGYNVYCNDLPLDIKESFLDKKTPDQFALIRPKATELEERAYNNFVEKNPFREYLKKEDCKVPVVTETGRVAKVDAVSASQADGVDSFTITKCGGNNVIMSKLVENNYCVTLIPVDKQGREFKDCAISSCEKTNSIINLAIKRLLESKYGEVMIIPQMLIPESLRDHIKLPDADDFKDWASGDKDLSDMIDMDAVSSSLKSQIKSALFQEINQDLAGTAFENSINQLDDISRNKVLSKISESIKDEDAIEIFEMVTEEKNMGSGAKQIVLSKSTEFVKDETVKEIIQSYAKTGNIMTTAFKTMQEESKKDFDKMSIDAKKELLIKAADKNKAIKDSALQKALNKGCIKTTTASTKTIIDCLDENEVNKMYSDAMASQIPSQKMIEAQIEQMEPSRQKEILSEFAGKKDFRGTAKTQLMKEIDSMPDSAKKEIIQGMLESNVEASIQNEMIKMLPARPDLMKSILKDGDVQRILGETLKAQLESQLKLFVKQDCK